MVVAVCYPQHTLMVNPHVIGQVPNLIYFFTFWCEHCMSAKYPNTVISNMKMARFISKSWVKMYLGSGWEIRTVHYKRYIHRFKVQGSL